MSIHLNNNEIDKIYLGNTQIDKIYKGSVLVYSAWEDGVLFTEGQVFEELGGITTSSTNGVTAMIEDNHIYSKVQMYNGTNQSASIGFAKPINVTNYNTLYALVDYSFPAWSRARALQLGTNFGGLDKGYADSYDGAYDGAAASTATQKTIKIDISNLSGEYYVSWMLGTTPNSPWIKHYKIWME